MHTNNPTEPQGYPNQHDQNPHQSITLEPHYEQPTNVAVIPQYDEITPGEPAQYIVPAEYRRPFGEAPRDKRGKFWTISFASAISAAASYIVLFTPVGFYGVNLVAAIAAIVMGIRALIVISKSPTTSYSRKAKINSWLGIAGGAINLVLTILAVVGLIALFSTSETTDYCNVFSTDYDSFQCQMSIDL